MLICPIVKSKPFKILLSSLNTNWYHNTTGKEKNTFMTSICGFCTFNYRPGSFQLCCLYQPTAITTPLLVGQDAAFKNEILFFPVNWPEKGFIWLIRGWHAHIKWDHYEPDGDQEIVCMTL